MMNDEKEEFRKKISYRQRMDRFLAVAALAAIVIAWFGGYFKAEVALTPFLKQAVPEAHRLEPLSSGYYAAWKDQSEKQLIGYLAAGTAHGYGGALKMIVALSPKGSVLDLVIVDHKETASFIQRVLNSDLLESMKGKAYSDTFLLDRDIDGVSGATYTSRALADAARRGSRKIANDILGLPTPPEPPPQIQFGFIEAVLIGLFITGYIGTRQWFKYKKFLRWTVMLMGFVVLGFIYNKLLTLIFINKMLLGFWPQWQTHLFWYILIGGILLILIIENRNLYCERICPFGAAQECFRVIGGGKVKIPKKVRSVVRWVQRGLALSVILFALVYSNPAVFNYEISGAFFHLIGSTFLFALMGIVLITALFIKRPWCNFLCPIRPVIDYFRLIRNWIRG